MNARAQRSRRTVPACGAVLLPFLALLAGCAASSRAAPASSAEAIVVREDASTGLGTWFADEASLGRDAEVYLESVWRGKELELTLQNRSTAGTTLVLVFSRTPDGRTAVRAQATKTADAALATGALAGFVLVEHGDWGPERPLSASFALHGLRGGRSIALAGAFSILCPKSW